MPNILIRDVPQDLHAALQQRAAQSGKSLQQYLLDQLRQLTDRPSLDEVLARIEAREGGGRVGLKKAAEILREDRSR